MMQLQVCSFKPEKFLMDDLDTISLDRELQTSSYLWYWPIKLIYIVEAEGQLLDAWIFFL